MRPPKQKWEKPVQIKTERFVLKPLLPRHATRKYLTWLRDDASSRYISTAKKTRRIKDLQDYIKLFSNSKDCIFLRILTKKSNRHIGNIKYHPIDLEKKTAVMGILIGEISWRGKGVANEVIRNTSNWLKNKMAIKRIVLGVSSKNLNAIRAYQKAGFYFPRKDSLIYKKNRMIKNLV